MERFGGWLLVGTLWVLISCDSEGGGEGHTPRFPESPIIGAPDARGTIGEDSRVPWQDRDVPDSWGEFLPDRVSREIPGPGPGDAGPTDGLQIDDLWTAEIPPRPDAVLDLWVPDVPPDTQPGLCGGVVCPPERPLCIDNQCSCNNESCPPGQYCSNRQCVPCNVDTRCGPDCISCASQGLYCSLDGTRCIGCDAAHPCPPYQMCVNDFCQQCQDDGLCGPECHLCEGHTPLCQDDICVCSSTSCPEQHACDGMVCVPCTASDPEFCGPSCDYCVGATPHCHEGQCTLCNEHHRCGLSCTPCQGTTPLCSPDGTGCVQCLGDEHCESNEHCAGGECRANCTAQGCQSDTSTSRKRCNEEWTIGRLPATSTIVWDGNTTNQGNNDDIGTFFNPGPTKCWDAGPDQMYRIWLRPGDHFTVHLKNLTSTFDAMLKFYHGPSACHIGSGVGDDNLVDCYNQTTAGKDEGFSHTATKEGWHYLVVDGRRSMDDDWGAYRLTLTLVCAEPGCCCQ